MDKMSACTISSQYHTNAFSPLGMDGRSEMHKQGTIVVKFIKPFGVICLYVGYVTNKNNPCKDMPTK